MTGKIDPDSRISGLLLKQQSGGDLSPDEHAYLREWAGKSEYRQRLLNEISDDQWIRENLKYFQKSGNESRWNRLPLISAGDTKSKRHKDTARWTKWAVAAVVTLVIGCAAYFGVIYNSGKSSRHIVSNDIEPGRDGAILTLANGRQILLDTIQDGVIPLDSGAVARVQNNTLIYENAGTSPVYNTITTPKGRQYRVHLPDGTQVWLNNASFIRYPVTFIGNERKVEVSGEAYFEVAENAGAPFRVKIDDSGEVVVLGTHFNIKSYSGDADTKITLLEGSVKVSSRTGETVHINPGQQAQVANKANNKIKVQAVNALGSISWKKGYFNFDGLQFEEVMHLLERWYDVEVVYEKDIPQIEFGGDLNRNTSLKGAIKALEYYDVHLTLEGNKLIVR